MSEERKKFYPNIGAVKLKPGVRLLALKPTGKRYGVMWKGPGGSRPSAFFDTIERLLQKIAELNTAVAAGTIDNVPTKEELNSWRVFKTEVGDTPIIDVLTGWKAWRQQLGKPVCTLTVQQAVADYLKDEKKRLDNSSIKASTYRQMKVKIERFGVRFAMLKLDEVTLDAIESWLDDEMPAKYVDAPTTINGYLNKIGGLYYKYEEVCPKNPVSKFEKRTDKGDHVRVMDVKNVAKVFVYAMENRPWLLPRLATEFFCGMRHSAVGRMEKKNFSIEAPVGFEMPASIMKTGDRHFIDCMPSNWVEWVRLGWNQSDCWNMSESDYMHAKSNLFKDAEVELLHNAARHSFAAFHVSAENNPGLTATILCHRNQQMLHSVYRSKSVHNGRRITVGDADLYFYITPATANGIADGSIKIAPRTLKRKNEEETRLN